jgi:predicted dehydrogenase
MRKVKIGIVGCGNISGIYLEKAQTFNILEVAGCADIIAERAESQGKKYGVPTRSVADLLADPQIEIIVNLTTPDAHASVAMEVLKAGKSVYNEKPLAIQRADAQAMLELAQLNNLRIGCAPDTFLGAGLQTSRQVIDSGSIGEPVAAVAFMLCHGHESWHPAPEFYYQAGGGPMFDMGPYYLTALVHLLGPVQKVYGSTRITFPQRTITSQPKYGKVIDVEVPTHVVGILNFVNGAIVTIVTSFDVWKHSLPCIEIYGTNGTIRVPDPNGFGGTVEVWHSDSREWESIPFTHGYSENSRSLGVADMAHAICSGRKHRASGQMAFHVLDIMHAIHEAAKMGTFKELSSQVDRPEPFPIGMTPGVLDG